MCQAKTSYIETEIEWGARFEPRMTLEKGSFRVDLWQFHSAYQVPLPNCSACQVYQLMTLAGCNLQDSKASRDRGTWGDEMTEEDKDKKPSRGGFTIDNILEEKVFDETLKQMKELIITSWLDAKIEVTWI